MSSVYPEVIRAMAAGTLDVDSVTWKAAAVELPAAFDATHTVWDSLDGYLLGTAVTLPSVAVVVDTEGVSFTCDDSPALTLTGIDDADTIEAIVIYRSTGTPSTSTLACWLDQRSDSQLVAELDPTGDDISLTFPYGYWLRINI